MLRLVRTTTTLPLVLKLQSSQWFRHNQKRIIFIPFPAGPIVTNLREELPIGLHTPEGAYCKHTRAIDCKQRAYAIELAGEDLEHDQGEAELTQARPNISSFKGSLGCSNLDQFLRSEDDRPGPMESQVVAILGVARLFAVRRIHRMIMLNGSLRKVQVRCSSRMAGIYPPVWGTVPRMV